MGNSKEPSQTKVSVSHYAIAGAASGFITRCIFQPLDVLKIRFQLQIEPIRKSDSSKYKGIPHAVRCIYREEGILALWKGMVPAQTLSVTYGALQFLAFEVFSQQCKKLLPDIITQEYPKHAVNFTCGAVAGFIATVGSFPFDVTRTRLVAQGEPKTYHGMFHAATTMVIKEGPRSLYKGLVPTLIQIVPHAGFQFAFYKMFQSLWILVSKSNDNQSSAFQNGCCGAVAGIGAKFAIYPLDLIKKRFQVQGFEEARKAFGAVRTYRSYTHCIYSILKEESLRGLYKGLGPSVLKAALTTGSHFLFYEEALKILAYLDSQHS